MPRLDYNPSYVCLYFDSDAINFYQNNSNFNNYKDKYINSFLTKVNTIFPDIHFLSNFPLPLPNFKIIKENSEINFFNHVLPLLPESKSDNEDWDEVCILYFSGIAPLLDINLTESIWNQHKKFLSQYSYSENLPDGIIPRIITREFLKTIPQGNKQEIHDFFLKNINQYDVEIFFEHPDLRQYRLNLIPKDVRSHHLISNIFDTNPNFQYKDLLPFIQNHSNLFRSFPSWIELELYRGCELKCTFCPRQFIDTSKDGSFLNLTSIIKIQKDLEETRSAYTICLGGMGEPFLHPDISNVIKKLLSGESIKELVIETALYVDWNIIQNSFKDLTENEISKLTFIVNLTTSKESRYNQLYGKNLFNHVHSNLENLIQNFPINNIHVQILKILEVEDEVDEYFTKFEKKKINIIFQKYNRYNQLMPEKRVSDLTPLKKEFCWHLARDLYINSDGSVSLCKQVSNSKSHKPIGNINESNLMDVWINAQESFRQSLIGQHGNTGAPCLECDEWYTFNA